MEQKLEFEGYTERELWTKGYLYLKDLAFRARYCEEKEAFFLLDRWLTGLTNRLTEGDTGAFTVVPAGRILEKLDRLKICVGTRVEEVVKPMQALQQRFHSLVTDLDATLADEFTHEELRAICGAIHETVLHQRNQTHCRLA